MGARKPNNWPSNRRKLWNSKLIEKLWVTMTLADPERFTLKDKPVTYTCAFVKLYNWRNHCQVHEIYEIVELKKMCTLTAENLRNLSTHRIIKIFSILRNANVILSNQDKFVFYVNNSIDWDQFNQLYNLNWMTKGISNTDAVTCKLELVLTRATNQRLEIAR